MGTLNDKKEKLKKKEEKTEFKRRMKEAKHGDASAQLFVARGFRNGVGAKQNDKKAAKFFSLAADQGDPEAMCAYGDCLHYGRGVKSDRGAAAKYYSSAAEKGNADAEANLGGYYLFGYGGMATDTAKAVPLIEKAYEQGSIRGMYFYGYCLENGCKIAKNLEKAVECYTVAANKDDTDACAAIARLYQNGIGVDKDLTKALAYYKKGAEGGNVDAQYGYARLMENGEVGPRDYHKIAQWYKKAADSGHAEAMACLGSLYERNLGVFFPSSETALSYYRESAKKGCARGYDYLGSHYEFYYGIENHKSKAANYYAKAAAMGYPDGMAHLGHCLRIGFGAVQNITLAKEYLQKAMYAGSAEAYCEWGLMLELSVDVHWHTHPTYVEAFQCYKKAAEMGSARGQSELARCYSTEMGCEANRTECLRLAKLAAEQGHPGGIYWQNVRSNIKKAALNGYPYAEYVYGKDLLGVAEFDERDPKKREALGHDAYFYLNAAAEHGCVYAMQELMDEYGNQAWDVAVKLLGIKPNAATSLEYAQMMLRYGFVRGHRYLGEFYDSKHWRTGIKKDDKKAFEHYIAAAGKDDFPDFSPTLGEMYLNGRGTEKNYAEAVKYLSRSYYGYNGRPRVSRFAGYWLGLCYEKGYGVPRDTAKAIELYQATISGSDPQDYVEEERLALQALKRLGQ